MRFLALAALSMFAFYMIAWTPGTKPGKPRYIRKNATSITAQKDLVALNTALKIMRTKDCSDPTSWYYQGGIHWVPDTVNNNKFCSSYSNPGDLKEGWDNCTHSKSRKEKIHFLVWHRMYIYNLERIVRKLSGYQDFALPYWAYTNTTDKKLNRTLPSIFRDQNSGLFEQSRYDSLNKGYPLSGSIVRNLSLTKLNECTLYSSFNNSINASPHGAMHDYIGQGNDSVYMIWNPIYQQTMNGGLMANVPSAAFDPIFWLHHSNIDRIWQQWTNSANGQLVTKAELESVPWPYVFFDENGNKVTYSVDEIMDVLYTMDYDFDDTKVMPKPQAANLKLFMPEGANPEDTIIDRDVQRNISAPVTSFNIQNRDSNKKIVLSTGRQSKGKKIIMTVTVSFTTPPQGHYEVYINSPAGVATTPESKYFVGFMTFFGADHDHNKMDNMDGMHDMHHMQHDTKKQEEFVFEITNEALETSAFKKDDIKITILKFNGAANESITIENVSMVKL